MANKKRKNNAGTQKKGKAATASSSKSIEHARTQTQIGNRASSSGNQNSDGRNHRVFSSFPLHLVPNNEYAGMDNTRELHELCKGRVWVIPSFFSHKECKAWIEFCESFGNSSSSSNNNNGFEYTAHPASKYVANRECYRLQQENARELSERIFRRLRGMTLKTDDDSNDDSDGKRTSILSRIQSETADLYPPPTNKNNNNNNNKEHRYKPIHCNPNIRVYRYDKGHAFGRHVDESNIVPSCGDGTGGGTTEMTMLVYLSTCRGGATRFHTGSTSRSSPSSFAFAPEVGALLLHVHGKHCLEHEADVVLGGKKYVLRTDLVYGNE